MTCIILHSIHLLLHSYTATHAHARGPVWRHFFHRAYNKDVGRTGHVWTSIMSTGYTLDTIRATDWPQVRVIYVEGIEAGNATFETEHAGSGRRGMLRTFWSAGSWRARMAPGHLGCAPRVVPPPRLRRRDRDQSVRCKGDSGQGRRSRVARPADRQIRARAGIWTLQSTILAENAISIALHASMGFQEVGTGASVSGSVTASGATRS